MKLIIIKKLFRVLREIPYVGVRLYHLSNIYIDVYRHFSYDINENGESKLIERVCNMNKDKLLIFFDVGANVGEWTKLIRNCHTNTQGHLFELSQSTYHLLVNNLGDVPELTLNNLGLGETNKDVEYQDYGTAFGGNTLLLDANYHKRDVVRLISKIVSGDSYCSLNNVKHINFLKIDTEGYEWYVLQGFDQMLKDKNIDIIQFEYGYTHADAKTLMKDFFELFESYGYILGQLRENGVKFKNFEYSDNDFRSGPNYVACLPQFKNMLEIFDS